MTQLCLLFCAMQPDKAQVQVQLKNTISKCFFFFFVPPMSCTKTYTKSVTEQFILQVTEGLNSPVVMRLVSCQQHLTLLLNELCYMVSRPVHQSYVSIEKTLCLSSRKHRSWNQQSRWGHSPSSIVCKLGLFLLSRFTLHEATVILCLKTLILKVKRAPEQHELLFCSTF